MPLTRYRNEIHTLMSQEHSEWPEYSSALARMMLATSLRGYRQAGGLSMDQVVGSMWRLSSSDLMRIETGTKALRTKEVRDLGKICSLNDEALTQLLGHARNAQRAKRGSAVGGFALYVASLSL